MVRAGIIDPALVNATALLNAASNVLNQYYDIENDRLNKPDRPLVAGAISMRAGWWYAMALYAAAVLPTWLVVVYPATSFGERFLALSERTLQKDHRIDRTHLGIHGNGLLALGGDLHQGS